MTSENKDMQLWEEIETIRARGKITLQQFSRSVELIEICQNVLNKLLLILIICLHINDITVNFHVRP